VFGKVSKIVLVPLPPAVGRAIDQAIGTRSRGSILLNRRGRRMAEVSVARLPRMHPHMLRHTL
jgi:integrase